jgi:hypothetical protein
MDSNYTPPSAEPPFDPDKYTPPSAEPPVDPDKYTPPSTEPEIIDVTARETPKTSGFDSVPENLGGAPAKPQAEKVTPPSGGGMSSNTRTVLIIVAVVLVVLCCCCLIVAVLGSWLWNNGDYILDRLSFWAPALSAWLA